MQLTHPHYLLPLFVPRRVALIGATEHEGKLGRFVLDNLLASGFTGELYLINPKYQQVLGRPCHASLADVEPGVDLAVIVTPAATIPAILKDAGKRRLRAAVILSAGFAEIGEEGKALLARVVQVAKEHGIRLLGPNCLGIMRTDVRLNATFARTAAHPGRLALISQSGAVCTAILDWAASAGIGFSSVISLGETADIDFGEALDFLLSDQDTDHILIYVEGVRDARRFMSSLRSAARTKPVIAIKVGRHRAGTKAVSSHTGALVGSDRVFAAALRRAGTVRVMSYTQLFAAARILAAGRLTAGNRLAIVTNGGGPGVMAADCAEDNDVVLAQLAPETLATLDRALPSTWSHGNPVDVIGDAPAERFEHAVAAVLGDDNVDAVLALYSPQIVTSPRDAADAVIRAAHSSSKPVLVAWMGQLEAPEIRGVFDEAKVPNFYTPENAVEAFSFLAAYRRNQELLLQVPAPLPELPEPDIAAARALRERVLADGRTLLTQDESFALLASFGISVPKSIVATTVEEAQEAARSIGYPVVLKIHSHEITHKTDVGGVRLGLVNGRSLAAAYHDMMEQVTTLKPEAKIEGVIVQPMLRYRNGREVLIGVTTDAVFGPVITFGSGGVAVEQWHDAAVMLPPLNRKLALDLIAGTRVSRVLAAYRNFPAVDQDALVNMLLQVSAMCCELPWLAEMDLNPVLAHEKGAIVADARIVIDREREIVPERYRHMAIHPYPAYLEKDIALRDGTPLKLRPIRPEDAEMEINFVARMSEQSRYLRFLHTLPKLTPRMLARFTQIDYDSELALIALHEEAGKEAIVGVARYVPHPDRESAEYAVTIADDWQQRGLGTLLLSQLLQCAKRNGLKRIEGTVLAINRGMLRLTAALGFTQLIDPESPDEVQVHIDLG